MIFIVGLRIVIVVSFRGYVITPSKPKQGAIYRAFITIVGAHLVPTCENFKTSRPGTQPVLVAMNQESFAVRNFEGTACGTSRKLHKNPWKKQLP